MSLIFLDSFRSTLSGNALDMMLPIAIQTGPRSDRFSTRLRVLEPRVRKRLTPVANMLHESLSAVRGLSIVRYAAAVQSPKYDYCLVAVGALLSTRHGLVGS